MRNVLIAMLTCSVLHTAAADEAVPLVPSTPQLATEAQRARRRAIAVEMSGLGLAMAGSTATVVGAVMAPSVAGDSPQSKHTGTVGIALLGVGLAVGMAGTTLWIIGGVQERRAKPALGVAASGLGGRF